MENDSNTEDSGTPAAITNQLADDAAADPVAVVLMLQQEAGKRQPEDNPLSAPLKKAAIKDRVLRRMLENSLEPALPAKRPNLKIVK